MFPSSRILIYGNTASADKYIGLNTDSAFSYNNLKSVLNPITPYAVQSYYKVYHFRYDGVEYLLPAQPMATASYKEIYEKGMIYGTDDTGPDLMDASVGIVSTPQNATITDTTGAVWKIRLMKGAPNYTYGSAGIIRDNPNFIPPTEFEIFTYCIYNNLNSTLHNPIFTIPVQEQITKSSLTNTTTRRWCIVQGTDTNRSTPHIIGRGRFDVVGTADYTFAQFSTSSTIPTVLQATSMWWPIFEKV